MPTQPADDPLTTRRRQAVEHVTGGRLPQTWPHNALPAGTRVRIVRDPDGDGPWPTEPSGVIDTIAAPELVQHPRANPDELKYWVTFDEPQHDSGNDGPYQGAQIWDRYLEPEQHSAGASDSTEPPS